MATHNARWGWQWDKPERVERSDPVRRAQRRERQVSEQVRRIGLVLADYLPQAEAAHRHLRDGLGPILKLDLSGRGPKYQPLAPVDVDAILARLPDLLKPWEQFLTSPAFAAAARQKNKEIRAHNTQVRAQNRAVREQQAAECEKLRAFYAKADAGDLAGALAEAAKQGWL